MNDAHRAIASQPYSTYNGIAAESIEPNSITLLVICPELMPQTAFGTLGAGITENTSKLRDRDNKPIVSSATTSNHLVATWEGKGNHRTPPLVQKGEPVEIYKAANQDKFYWRETAKGREFRTVDRIIMEASAADPAKPRREKDDTNTWTTYLDPSAKKLGFQTSKDNGEAIALAFDADVGKGIIALSDDLGNRFVLDSGVNSGLPFIQINLSTGSVIKLEKDDLLVQVKGKILLDAGDRTIFNAPLTIFNVEKKGSIIFNASSIAFNALSDLIVTAGGAIGLNGAATKVKGALVAAAMRVADLTKGPVGAPYEPVTISQPVQAQAKEPRNSLDTLMSTIPFLHQ